MGFLSGQVTKSTLLRGNSLQDYVKKKKKIFIYKFTHKRTPATSVEKIILTIDLEINNDKLTIM